MSADLISRSPDLLRLQEEGFELDVRQGFLIVHAVPYVRRDTTLARGQLICVLPLASDGSRAAAPADHTMYFAGDVPCHRDGTPMTNIINSSFDLVVAPGLTAQHYLSSKPEGTGRYADFYEKVTAYELHISGAARSHDRTADARTGQRREAGVPNGPFAIPDSASARYGTAVANTKLSGKVAIIGLGGTGAYVLDLVAKTLVEEIHLYDGDQLLNHNLFRSPGSPDTNLLRSFPSKVEYYTTVYGRMHRGIRPHPVRVTAANIAEFAAFDFVFVCVDKGSSRREIAQGLSGLGRPFIDTGIGIGLEGETLDGCARATFIASGTNWGEIERLLPMDEDRADDVYRSEIQIAEMNSLNAVLAVLRWKRWAGFYRDERAETNAAFMIEGNCIFNR
jgi:hypothetical protein